MDAHPFVPGTFFDSRDICHQWNPDVGYCRRKRADHAGESPLNDGPVRSTVERQQERIKSLEAHVEELKKRIKSREEEANSLFQEVSLRDARLRFHLNRHEMQMAEVNEKLEEVMYSRDLLRDQLSNLNNLAREVSERVNKLVGALDK